MKKIFSLFVAALMCACTIIPASAVEPKSTADLYALSRAAEIQSEMDSAEDILGGPCKLKSEETQRVGDYVVESRLYVLDAPLTRASSGEVGGVSSHVWRMYESNTWDTKVLLAAFFYYNGSTAICIQEDADFWAVKPDNSTINKNFNPQFSYKDGTTAKVSCQYARDEPGTSSDMEIWGTLKVTCTKNGSVGIESEVEHQY
ncbi:hypothetical protein OBV_31370 [Oscillibacter valericigenes Sjm18-20]|nr:hypothetical protein OBV_31370 [Oscillibacter valericigenes Sjm18-20]